MKKHYVRSILYTLLGMILSLILWLIVLPFILIHRLIHYIRQRKTYHITLKRSIDES